MSVFGFLVGHEHQAFPTGTQVCPQVPVHHLEKESDDREYIQGLNLTTESTQNRPHDSSRECGNTSPERTSHRYRLCQCKGAPSSYVADTVLDESRKCTCEVGSESERSSAEDDTFTSDRSCCTEAEKSQNEAYGRGVNPASVAPPMIQLGGSRGIV